MQAYPPNKVMGVSRLNKERDDAIDAIKDSRTHRISRCWRARPGTCVLRESRERVSQLPYLSAGRLSGGHRHAHHGGDDHHANSGADRSTRWANAAGAAADLDRDGWCSATVDRHVRPSGIAGRRHTDASAAAANFDGDRRSAAHVDRHLRASGHAGRRHTDATATAPDLDRDGWRRVAGAAAVGAPHISHCQ